MPDLRNWFTRPSRRRQRHALVGRTDLWQMKRAFQIDFLRAEGLQPQQRLLDIGCGSLRGGIALIDYLEVGCYTGVDVRESVLVEADRELSRAKLSHKRPVIKLASEGLDALEFAARFDVVWAFSVLFHLSEEILDACFSMVQRCLAPNGVFYANVILGEGTPGRWQSFPVLARTLEAYSSLAGRHGMRMERVGVLSELGHHSGEPSQDNQTMLAFRAGGA